MRHFRREPLPAGGQGERKPSDLPGQARMELRYSLPHPEAGKAQRGDHPRAAVGRRVSAADIDFPRPLLAAAGDVDRRRAQKEGPRLVQPPDPAGGQGIHARGQA